MTLHLVQVTHNFDFERDYYMEAVFISYNSLLQCIHLVIVHCGIVQLPFLLVLSHCIQNAAVIYSQFFYNRLAKDSLTNHSSSR